MPYVPTVFYPPFVTKLGNLVTPFLEKDLDASVGLSDICLIPYLQDGIQYMYSQ